MCLCSWSLALASSIPVLGLDRVCPRKGCPWPWIFLRPWPRALCPRLHLWPLLFRIERSQLRWFGHVSRMPQERLAKQALFAKANGRSPVGQPRTRWTDWFEDLGWNRLGFHPSEIMNVMEDREMSQMWRLNSKLLPPQPSRRSGQ